MNQCIVVKKELIDETLRAAAVPGKNLVEPLKSFAITNKLPFKILEDTKVIEGTAEVHTEDGDLWQCLSGEAIFTYGGSLVDPTFFLNPDGTANQSELKSKKIKGGMEVVLYPGDWLWIPPGQPHMHRCAGTSRLIVIKIPKK